jgi:phage baseplate assembly protein gpV
LPYSCALYNEALSLNGVSALRTRHSSRLASATLSSAIPSGVTKVRCFLFPRDGSLFAASRETFFATVNAESIMITAAAKSVICSALNENQEVHTILAHIVVVITFTLLLRCLLRRPERRASPYKRMPTMRLP